MFLLLILLILVGVLIYLYIQSVYKFWTKLGIKQFNPIFPVGNLMPLVKQETSIAEFFIDTYFKTKHEKFVGYYNFLKPVLIVNDPDLIKRILIRDFAHFTDHDMYINEKDDPLSAHMFALQGEKWKSMRMKLNPAFSPTKIKGMFPIIRSRAENLRKYVESADTVEIHDLMARYTTDFIASAAFGYEIDSINDPTNEFRVIAGKAFEASNKTIIRQAGTFLFPNLMKNLGILHQTKEVADFFFKVTRVNVEYREKNETSRKDFLQLMIQLRNQGEVNVDEWESKTSEKKSMTMDQLTAQVYMFFLAGYETSSTTLAFCLYEIAKNPEVQRKVQHEVDSILAEHGEFTYESIQDMKYMEQVMDETLRLYPPISMLSRECVKDYPIPDTDIVLPAKTGVLVPIMGIQRDEKFFPNPLEFMPERFTDPAQLEIMKSVYHPFGSGPRVCVGLRMAKVVVRLALAQLLSTCNFQLVKDDPIRINKKLLLLAPMGGVHLSVSHR